MQAKQSSSIRADRTARRSVTKGSPGGGISRAGLLGLVSLVAIVASLAGGGQAPAQTTDPSATTVETTADGTSTGTSVDGSTSGIATTPEGTSSDETTTSADTTTVAPPTDTGSGVAGTTSDVVTTDAGSPVNPVGSATSAEAALIPLPANVVDAVLTQIAALGGSATPAEVDLVTLLENGQITDVTALAGYLVDNDSLALLDLVGDTLLASGDLGAAQAIIPQLLQGGLLDSAVAIVQQVIANGDVTALLPVLPDVLEALDAAGDTGGVSTILTQLLAPDVLQALLADPANTALLTGLFQSLVDAGQAGVLTDIVPGLVEQLVSGGLVQQAVMLITSLADAGALTSLPGLLNLVLTPELFEALLANPANLTLVTGLLSSVVNALASFAPQLGDLAEILPVLTGQLQSVVSLIEDLVDLVGALSGPVVGMLEPLQPSASIERLVEPVVDTSLFGPASGGTSSLLGTWPSSF